MLGGEREAASRTETSMLNSHDDGLRKSFLSVSHQILALKAPPAWLWSCYHTALVKDATAAFEPEGCMQRTKSMDALRARRCDRERFAQATAALIQAPQYFCKGESYAAPI